jgi:large subunit ribosomal protein L10
MPTEAKKESVKDLADRMSRASIAVATDFNGLSVNQTTALRAQLRQVGVEYKVVKNRLAKIAAEESGVVAYKDILEGSTGVVFGYGDIVAAAKALDEYVKQSRVELKVRKGVMNGVVISPAQVQALAALPPREELLAKLLGQMNAPISGLVTVLSGTMRGLAIVLQRRAEQLGGAEA